MEIEMLDADKKNNRLTFFLKNSEAAFANAIRRNAIEEVPTMAIEDVEFRRNNSSLYDEIVAHRLGLVSLKTDLLSYTLPEKCKCGGEGCASCQLKLTLKVNGPAMVRASDLKSKDPKVKPVFSETPIVKLLKGQKIELEATAVLGKGKEHAKWSPGLIYYKYKPNITIGTVKNPEDVVEQCPKNIFEVKNGKISIIPKNLTECHLCGACEDVSKGAIKLEPTKDFMFYVESWGQLTPKEIIENSVSVLQEQLKEFEKIIK
ncbi:MAG: DNA-directed RNA polymerase subunit D [bacterium]|nr:DNA-directed RNA polymerase subunit D [bacterium]